MFIKNLISDVTSGRIRIPAFQRGFVWQPDNVAQLMDSIYKQYPFGSLLFWRTRNLLKSDRDLGPFTLPSAPDDFPIDYVLDGQQRLTSIFGVFQTGLAPNADHGWSSIYFDMFSNDDVQESRFHPLDHEEVDAVRYFPLNALFDTKLYGHLMRALPEHQSETVTELWTRFNQCDIPIQTFQTEDRAGVAIVFERVNRLGVELNTLQLLNAWTWSEDFDLQEQFGELYEEFEPFGFEGVAEDVNLLLRCCAAVVRSDVSPSTIMKLNGSEVRDAFPGITNGLRGAIDFVRRQFGVEKLQNLPYPSILVPLTVFFAEVSGKSVRLSQAQKDTLHRWFWRANFASRYGRNVQRTLRADIEEILKLKQGLPTSLDEVGSPLQPRYFLENKFSMGAVASKTFILLLASAKPLSLISGQDVDLRSVLSHYNRHEFHHLYPQQALKSLGVDLADRSPLANFCFINSIENKKLGGREPSAYRGDLAQNFAKIADAAFIDDVLFQDNYEVFLDARAERLARYANLVMGFSPSVTR